MENNIASENKGTKMVVKESFWSKISSLKIEVMVNITQWIVFIVVMGVFGNWLSRIDGLSDNATIKMIVNQLKEKNVNIDLAGFAVNFGMGVTFLVATSLFMLYNTAIVFGIVKKPHKNWAKINFSVTLFLFLLFFIGDIVLFALVPWTINIAGFELPLPISLKELGAGRVIAAMILAVIPITLSGLQIYKPATVEWLFKKK